MRSALAMADVRWHAERSEEEAVAVVSDLGILDKSQRCKRTQL